MKSIHLNSVILLQLYVIIVEMHRSIHPLQNYKVLQPHSLEMLTFRPMSNIPGRCNNNRSALVNHRDTPVNLYGKGNHKAIIDI